MKKIHLLIWSKNRACQLRLLLDSIERYAPDVFDINIVYKYTDDQFQAGYEKIIGKLSNYSSPITLIQESDLREDTLNVICNKSFDHIAFCTDDTVIYKEMPCEYKALYAFLPQHVSEVFSFRLGLNTTVQDHNKGTSQPPLNRYLSGKHTIHWNSNQYHSLYNYGYPLAMDLHVFRQDISTRIIAKEMWHNSNQLESTLFKHSTSICYMSSFRNSIAVNIPINNLSGVTTENEKNYSPEELNSKYLNGHIIDLNHISTIKFCGCHANVDIKMVSEKRLS